ncbi:hypothetical protein [Telmatospirillum sp.]|uniref:hypothetical protein n=1 Tax=Telmatospirillum sp. TaxID=2079197 RepID=UPI002849B1D7|nr:hypothetical protein [Telmatospirillum sp.]MDR3439847.1 hypothetical protein [Telmatospirillum sp.]
MTVATATPRLVRLGTSRVGFLHFCKVCGEWGAYGYEASLLKHKAGIWYCREHRPDAKQGGPL